MNPSHSPDGVYELRIYTPRDGKSAALHDRFRRHTMRLMERHGIHPLGFWVPVDPQDLRLHFLSLHPAGTTRDTAWSGFDKDPEWRAAKTESESDGPIVASAQQIFLTPTDYSIGFRLGNVSRGGVFEYRDYTTPPGYLPHIDARFRDHTRTLFDRQGMTHWGYYHRLPSEPEAAVRLHYFLCHPSHELGLEAFRKFRLDPDWIAARTASEQRAGGPLTLPDGVKSTYLKATDYSPAC